MRGETPQPFHFDDQFCRMPRPRVPFSMATVWALDDNFKAENGATVVIPGSHTWDDQCPAPSVTGIGGLINGFWCFLMVFKVFDGFGRFLTGGTMDALGILAAIEATVIYFADWSNLEMVIFHCYATIPEVRFFIWSWERSVWTSCTPKFDAQCRTSWFPHDFIVISWLFPMFRHTKMFCNATAFFGCFCWRVVVFVFSFVTCCFWSLNVGLGIPNSWMISWNILVTRMIYW